MQHRERFAKALAHQPVDRPPFDLHGTPMTLLNETLTQTLCSRLGIPPEEEALLQALDIDFRRVGSMLAPDSPIARRISSTCFVDCWGIERSLSGEDWQITHCPLKGATLDDLNAFPWPDAAHMDMRLLDAWTQEARRLYEETDYVVVGEHPVYGVLELGCWMCGFDDFLLKMAMEPEFVEAFFARVYAYQQNAIDLYYSRLGPYLHVTTSGDDFGTQRAPFISPRMFGELVAPWYDRRIALTKEYTSAAFFHHTCGAVYPLIPRMIESGVEILNPIQPTAQDMEPKKLKQTYGKKITFWGGADTQQVLPYGAPQDVRRHVHEILSVFGKEGGYIFAPAHVLQSDVPAENVLALFEAAREYCGV